jgi:hypothetical protein
VMAVVTSSRLTNLDARGGRLLHAARGTPADLSTGDIGLDDIR